LLSSCLSNDHGIDNAIFTAKFSANLGPKIAAAVLPLGLPETSLPLLIGDLAANNLTGVATIPGITAEIIGAGVGGLFEAYSLGFRFVWVAAGCFTVIAAICKFRAFPSLSSQYLPTSTRGRLNQGSYC